MGPGGFVLDARPAALTAACDEALTRLGTDRIDVLILGRVDKAVPIEESFGAMSRLVEAGKVLRLGLSEASPATIRRAAAVHRVTLLETEYSLGERHVEAELLPTLRALGVGLLAYSPLGRGLFGGTLQSRDDIPADDWRRNHPRFTDETFERNRAAAAALDPIATRLGATPPQIALAWLLAKGTDIVPIPGAKRRGHLEDNARAAEVALSADDVAALDAAFPPGAIAGERYPAHGMASIDR
jgi:aryl-alcohol dehydrogenase-like predicted oxidoreductase